MSRAWRWLVVGWVAAGMAAAQAPMARIGAPIGDFSLTSPQGAEERFSQLKGDTTVVLFVSTKCPVSNRYNARMIDLYKQYSDKGVRFVFVNSNTNEPAAEVETHSRQIDFPFPVYKDNNGSVAERFGAQFTPETYVIDRSGVVRYHGRIDDAQNIARVQHHSLRLAIDAVQAGAAVEQSETKAFGCTIKRLKKAS